MHTLCQDLRYEVWTLSKTLQRTRRSCEWILPSCAFTARLGTLGSMSQPRTIGTSSRRSGRIAREMPGGT